MEDALLGVVRPFNVDNLIVVSGVGTMQLEWSKFPNKMVWGLPYLDVRVMSHRNISNGCAERNKLLL